MKKLFVLSLVSSLLFSACASFNPNPTPTMSLDKFQYKEAVKGVTVAVDPYYSPVKTKGVFDNDFEGHEMLALLLDTATPDGSEYSLQKESIAITDGDGKITKPCTWQDAGECVGRGYGSSVAWFFITSFPGLIISAAHTASVNTDIETDLRNREFKYGDCSPAKTGFVYFNMEKYNDKVPARMTAIITLQNAKTKEPVKFAIPFSPEAGWYGNIEPQEHKTPVKIAPANNDAAHMGI